MVDRNRRSNYFNSILNWRNGGDMTKHKTKGHGRASFVTEVEADEINRKNKGQRTAENKRYLNIRRRLDDFKDTKELGITVDELNQNRMVG